VPQLDEALVLGSCALSVDGLPLPVAAKRSWEMAPAV
jgi:hypothetical protein